MSQPPSKVVGRPFSKGVSGNPGGRAKSFGNFIREQTNDGKELVELALRLLRKSRKDQTRMEALKWLADRGWGKAVEVLKDERPNTSLHLHIVRVLEGIRTGEITPDGKERVDQDTPVQLQ